MKTYQTTKQGFLAIGNSNIPVGHRFYKKALEEAEYGEAEILPYVEPPLIASEYRAAVGAYIDGKAQALGFDNIITAVTYADEPADPVNQAHGISLRAWRSLCWEYCRAVLASGETPTIQELIDGLPSL